MGSYVTQTSDKKKKTALICCLVAGIFGFHHFYVGNIAKGLLYLCTLGLFIFGVLVDLIKILTGSFRDNVGAPLRE